jgi:hypothetical protein
LDRPEQRIAGGFVGSVCAVYATSLGESSADTAYLDAEYAFRGLNYIFGCNPGSDISFVSGFGTVSKRTAYGSNRADYTSIAGGVVPGVLILSQEFRKNKEDWPFLWGENEYVISVGASYIFAVNAVNDLLNGTVARSQT